MRMIDCGRCDEPVAEDAATCPHCGEPVRISALPGWYRILIAALSVGAAFWFYTLISDGRISLLGALAGIALYAGAVWMFTNAVSGKNKR